MEQLHKINESCPCGSGKKYKHEGLANRVGPEPRVATIGKRPHPKGASDGAWSSRKNARGGHGKIIHAPRFENLPCFNHWAGKFQRGKANDHFCTVRFRIRRSPMNRAVAAGRSLRNQLQRY
jgi:hypothetical protein